jgi:hypothetical protein
MARWIGHSESIVQRLDLPMVRTLLRNLDFAQERVLRFIFLLLDGLIISVSLSFLFLLSRIGHFSNKSMKKYGINGQHGDDFPCASDS